MTRTLLTQSEAAFLLDPSASAAGDCLRAALLSLTSQGRIAVAEKSGRYAGFELILGSDAGPHGLTPHQRIVETTLRGYRDGKRLDANDVLVALATQFGSSFGRYVHDHIAPPLIEMGHVIRTDSKWLGLFPRIRYELTPSGRKVIEPLRNELASLDDLPALVKSNPDHALQLAHRAGVMLVLSPVARRQLPRLRKLMTKRDGDSGTVMLAGTDTSGSVEGFETPAWNFGASDCGLLDSVSAVCDATSGDSGPSDGGGDGGGGGD